ncbi:MAG TPA: alpha-L-fucosidase [Chitinophagaceae bacterium]|nr:alpha-L-fucosidase [Chitinophagaceae bacterium]
MRKLTIALCLCIFSLLVKGQAGYTPTPENLKARQWFDSARFGMFIHWGASSVLGHGEWVMQVRNIKVADYNRLQKIFNPIDFDAKRWVSVAKNAGMKYMTLITRHHDGFSLWDTKQSDWKVTNTPFKRDVVKEIADECHKQGIKLFFYYSLLDWYRSDYQYETGRTGKGTGRTEKSNWEHYIAFMKAQLTELLTNYGEISGIWFDGHWDQLDNDHDKSGKSKVNWHYDEIYSLIHKLQPQCLIGNNHHLTPLPGEDFQMFEKDLPGGNTTGFGGQEVATHLPLETCETINDAWGFNITDQNYKSVKQLIHYLVRDAGFGANFLLNVGPMPNGEIQKEFTDRLAAVGDWLKVNGATIYGTKGGFIRPQDWGAVTEKGNMLYFHILNLKNKMMLVQMPHKVKSIKLYSNKTPVAYEALKDNYIVLDLNKVTLDEIDTIIEVEVIK